MRDFGTASAVLLLILASNVVYLLSNICVANSFDSQAVSRVRLDDAQEHMLFVNVCNNEHLFLLM